MDRAPSSLTATAADVARERESARMSPPADLEISIRKRLGAFALDAQFATRARGLTALFGPSGSGKSTIVAAIAGLLRPASGRIVAGGETLFDAARGIDVPAERRRVGYVFQDARLFPHLKVRDNLAYGLKRAPAGDRAIGFDAVVELLGIGPLLERRPLRLSGGEKQRVAIGRALLAQPRLLLMDEPLASLDAARRLEILPYVERLRDELGLRIVYVSHTLEEVLRLASTIVVVDAGRVVAQGTPAELAQRRDLQPFFGRFEAGAVLEGRVASHDEAHRLTRVDLGRHVLVLPRLALAAGAAVRVRVRARDVILAVAPPEGLSVQNVLPGVVTEIVEEPGSHAEVKLDAAGIALLARVTRDSVHRLGLAPGRPVFALVKSVAIDGDSVTAAPLDLE
jgi:molybdate transport system ATP-binding protein